MGKIIFSQTFYTSYIIYTFASRIQKYFILGDHIFQVRKN